MHLDHANSLGRRRNAERKKYGFCIRCPNKAEEGHVLCGRCMELLRLRDLDLEGQHMRAKTKQQERMAAGLCKWCDRPNVLGRSLCEPHLKAERNKVRAYRADRKAKGLCWRCNDPVRLGGSLCQKHRDEVTEKERGKGSARRARLPVTSTVVEVKPAPEESAPVLPEEMTGDAPMFIQTMGRFVKDLPQLSIA